MANLNVSMLAAVMDGADNGGFTSPGRRSSRVGIFSERRLSLAGPPDGAPGGGGAGGGGSSSAASPRLPSFADGGSLHRASPVGPPPLYLVAADDDGGSLAAIAGLDKDGEDASGGGGGAAAAARAPASASPAATAAADFVPLASSLRMDETISLFEYRFAEDGGGGAAGGGAAGASPAPSPGSVSLAASAAEPAAYREVELREVLARVRAAVAAEAASPLGGLQLGAAAPPLSGWDAHLLEPDCLPRVGDEGFHVRRGCLLLSLPPLRAAITARACFFAPEAGADGELTLLLRLLRAGSCGGGDGGGAAAPPAVVALSAVLTAVRADLAAASRAVSASVSRLADRVHKRAGAEEVLAELMGQAESETSRLLDRFDGALAAVTAFAELESAHARSAAAGGARALLGALHELAAVFGMRVKSLQAEVEETAALLAARKKVFTMRTARHRNRVLLIGLALPLISVSMAFCSMMSGWFGMNLDNGTCGPDGCNVWGNLQWDAGALQLPFTTTDHGNQRFVALVVSSSIAVLIAGGALWAFILTLF